MSYPPNVWSQLKNTTVEKLMKALEKDGWEEDNPSSCRIPYVKTMDDGEKRRIVIHYHPKKTYGAKLLKGLLNDIGWSVEDLKRLNLAG